MINEDNESDLSWEDDFTDEYESEDIIENNED